MTNDMWKSKEAKISLPIHPIFFNKTDQWILDCHLIRKSCVKFIYSEKAAKFCEIFT